MILIKNYDIIIIEDIERRKYKLAIQYSYNNTINNTNSNTNLTYTTCTPGIWSTSDSISVNITEMSENLKEATKSIKELGTAVKKATFKPTFDVSHIKQPLPDEIIIVNFHLNEIDVEQAGQIVKDIQKAFPYNEVIGKFDCCDLLIGHGYEVIG